MNRIIKILKIITIIAVPIFLQAFASNRNNNRKLKDLTINYLGNQNIYITDENIRTILFNDINPNIVTCKELKIKELERRLDNNPMIENSDVYLTIDAILKVNVKQREPIGRIFNGKNFYYIDIKGKEMPLSNAYSARVPLITGVINAEQMEDIYTITKYIYDDKFLSENITEINVNKNFFRLKMRIADFDVILGGINDIKIKFDNLKAFYKKASKDNILDKYKQINLQYSNQVVCTK